MAKIKLNKASKGEVFGFSFNNASTNAVFLALSLYFLVYCTSYYGMSPIIVGFIMTGTRLFDAVTDPIIGLLIDRTDTRFGRFRPWIFGGAIISALMFVFMFSGIRTGAIIGDYVLITVFYSIFIIGYTMQTACTKSAQTILTSDMKQRTMVNSLGMVWTMVVYAVAMGMIMPIVNGGGGVAVALGWQRAAIAVAGIQLFFAAFVVFALRKKDVKENYGDIGRKNQPKIMDYLDVFQKNKALQMLIVAASTNKIAQTLQSGMTVVFYFYVVQNQKLQGVVPLATMLLLVIFMFCSIGFINKYGRVEVFKWSSLGGCIYGFLMIPLIAVNPSNPGWLIAVFAVNQLLIAGTTDQNLMSMIGDAADYEYYINDRFIPGMIGTSFSLIDKVVSSLSTTFVGVILGAVGFVGLNETPASPKMFWTILIAYCAVPAIGHFFSVIGMHFHPLKKNVHDEMLIDLAKRGR